MSTNIKNRLWSAYFRNFTTMIERRVILIDKKLGASSDFEQRILSVNEEINKLIQDLNIIVWNRQIPYFTLLIKYGDVIEKDTRIYVHDWDTPKASENTVKQQLEENITLSHILDILVTHSYKIIKKSDISCNAGIIIDNNLIECAVADILLDIAMFNSFSFLKQMSQEEKKEFSKQKYAFYQENNLGCYYECEDSKILYYSFAFSARTSEKEIDLHKYIEIWTEFLRIYYPQNVHIEKTIKEQLRYHVDYDQLPVRYHLKFAHLNDGAYLVLRTNKNRTADIQVSIFQLFGIASFTKGKVCIVPINDYEKYKQLLKNLDVSVFKIVKSTPISSR